MLNFWFRKDVVEASETDSESPQVPPYIGECIYKIATHLSYKPCFIGYSFRDDMERAQFETKWNNEHPNDQADPTKSKSDFESVVNWTTMIKLGFELDSLI